MGIGIQINTPESEDHRKGGGGIYDPNLGSHRQTILFIAAILLLLILSQILLTFNYKKPRGHKKKALSSRTMYILSFNVTFFLEQTWA